jgi:dihydroneopterin aldolase/2-amino-4-hydroxy-6-hydroxymethyldihydropteridine diphosphokinase
MTTGEVADGLALMPLVAIALGSNLGDRRAHLAWAVSKLDELLDGMRVSGVIETDPVGVPDEQPPYLNAVVVGKTDLEPVALLSKLMALERARGRRRLSFRAARTLDLDLLGDRP